MHWEWEWEHPPAPAEPSSQHSVNLLPFLLLPDTFLMQVQHHYPTVRSQRELLHSPAPQLGLWGTSLALTSAPQHTGHTWGQYGPSPACQDALGFFL